MTPPICSCAVTNPFVVGYEEQWDQNEVYGGDGSFEGADGVVRRTKEAGLSA